MRINIEKLTDLMIKKGMSYTDLSNKTKLSKTQIWRIFNVEDTKTRLTTISTLSKVLEVDYKEIVKGD
jgi:DNA-binding Xre family transcriptional regulator